MLVVLGCRVDMGQPGRVLEHRLETAARWAERERPEWVVMSGGKVWRGDQEARVMAAWWAERRLPGRVLVETSSQNTRENARETARALGELGGQPQGIREAPPFSLVLVTSDFHLSRARTEFERVGFIVTTKGAPTGGSALRSLQWRVRELCATLYSLWWVALLAGGLVGCRTESQDRQGAPTGHRAEESSTSEDVARPSSGGALGSLPTKSLPERLDLVTQARLGVAREPLERALFADGAGRRFAAWGLGKLCASPGSSLEPGAKEGAARPLEDVFVEAAALWALDVEAPESESVLALARALGECGTPRAELVLQSWLKSGSRLPIEAAAFGLGRIADRRGRLEESTLTLLLDLAESLPSSSLLYPLGRLRQLPSGIAERTIDVASKMLLGAGGGSRREAIFALGSAGPRAAPVLLGAAQAPGLGLSARGAALATLPRLGEVGEAALDELVRGLLERGLPATAMSQEWPLLLGALSVLSLPQKTAPLLRDLERAPLGPAATRAERAQRRRMILLRCRAAELTTKKNWLDADVGSCDPDGGRPGRLATLSALDRGKLTGKARLIFESLVAAHDGKVAARALLLLPRHREYEKAGQLLIEGARRAEAAVKKTALEVIAAHPKLVERGEAPDPEAVAAVLESLVQEAVPLEARLAALDAAGALGALTLKPAVEALCKAEGPSAFALRARARSALGLLGDPGRVCAPVPTRPKMSAASRPYMIRLMSDLGVVELRLEAPESPELAALILARFQASLSTPRAVSGSSTGFALQWGDLDGDGVAEESAPSVPSELVPEAPRAGQWVVGEPGAPGGTEALLFLLSDAPQLAGQKVILGTFSGPVELLVEGDEIEPVEVTPL